MANEAFDRWWNSSKYMQVVYSGAAERQIALDAWNARAALSSAAVAEREPVAFVSAMAIRHHIDSETSQTGTVLHREQGELYGEKHLALYLDPPPVSELEAENARLRKEQDALIEAAVIAERESCAFAVECHSGFGDPETIEACAQIVRDRCDPALRSDSIHLPPERYAELESTEARLAEAMKALEPFAEIAGEAWADGSGWTNAACQNDRICDWFGPSAFHAARRVREGGKHEPV